MNGDADAIATFGILAGLRAEGWMVAVHNDYRLRGAMFTFWLFTRRDGMSVKGEGGTDLEALRAARDAASALHDPSRAPADEAAVSRFLDAAGPAFAGADRPTLAEAIAAAMGTPAGKDPVTG